MAITFLTDKDKVLTYADQVLTDEEKAQARENIGAATVEEVAAVLPAISKPDWNQNDENASDYIKNRPFYEGDIVETEVADINAVTAANETEWVANSGIVMNGLLVNDSGTFFIDGIVEIGKEYVVIVNGTRYVYTAEDGANYGMTNCIMIGDNEAFASEDIANINVTLIFGVYENTYMLYGAIAKGDTAPTEYKLYSREPEIFKLDQKYLDLPEYMSDPTKLVTLNYSDMTSSMTPSEIVDAINQGFNIVFIDDNGYDRCIAWEINENRVGLLVSMDGSPYLYRISSDGTLSNYKGIQTKPLSGYYITNTQADQRYAMKSEVATVEDVLSALPTWTGGSY